MLVLTQVVVDTGLHFELGVSLEGTIRGGK